MNDYLQVAKECQVWARKLAPYQNRSGRFDPPSTIVRFWRWLWYRPSSPITHREVEKIVNALLSAGNIIEATFREQPQPQET